MKKKKDSEFLLIKILIDIKDNLKMTNSMDKENLFLKMEILIQVILQRINLMA
jgi:hypothetical protein